MRFPHFAALIVVLVPMSARAVDLTKIDRTIEKPPEGLTERAKYCLLVFGNEAKSKVWLIRDSGVLYVDRNANGDLTESSERVELKNRSFTVDGIGGPTDYLSDLRVYPLTGEEYRLRVKTNRSTYQYVGFLKADKPKFASRPEDAPIIHFGGPMTLGQYGPKQSFGRHIKGVSYRVTSLKLMVGTPGLGKGTFAAYHCKCRRKKTLTGEIEFARAGVGDPVRIKTYYKMRG